MHFDMHSGFLILKDYPTGTGPPVLGAEVSGILGSNDGAEVSGLDGGGAVVSGWHTHALVGTSASFVKTVSTFSFECSVAKPPQVLQISTLSASHSHFSVGM